MVAFACLLMDLMDWVDLMDAFSRMNQFFKLWKGMWREDNWGNSNVFLLVGQNH